jgi:predicted permease
MGRALLAVVISYVVMLVLAFLAFTCAFVIFGSEVVFRTGTYEASTMWIVVAFVINIIDAIIGGFICALIAKRGKAQFALALVVIVVGLVVAFGDTKKRETNRGLTRASNTPKFEEIQKAYWPMWVPFALPFTGAAGVLIGSRFKRRA